MRGRKIVKFIPPGEMRTHPVMPFWLTLPVGAMMMEQLSILMNLKKWQNGLIP